MKLNVNYIQFSLSYFLHNQQLMKIDFTSYHKTYFKKNSKKYSSNSYILVFLINVI